ncbi:acetyl-CoA acetyltransferase 2-like [Humulus lupulus]|uniref:acetyl-CoA acetyltransferase 2-like n=1 Tax=Humulus lupulus TaxID=3486 RepID=UPI002B41635A|nr:acetyl-CoA acetyltransferase 2-like [Humulus lupulus]
MFDAAKLRKLRTSFKQNEGSVTAGNASIISDGAAALVLVSGEKALQLGLQVIAKIKGYADAAQDGRSNVPSTLLTPHTLRADSTFPCSRILHKTPCFI